MAKSHVKVDTTAWKILRKRLAEADKYEVKVGVLAGAGGLDTNEDGLTMVDLAAIHEYGIGMPERSFIRKTFAIRRTYFIKLMDALFRRFVDNKLTAEHALALFGTKAVSEIRNTITSRKVTPDIKDETKERKGSTVPLVDTGQLINSISYVVVLKAAT